MPKGTELHVGFFAPQSKHIWTCIRSRWKRWLVGIRTLLAGFDFNLVKMFCDWVLVARAAMVNTGQKRFRLAVKESSCGGDNLGCGAREC